MDLGEVGSACVGVLGDLGERGHCCRRITGKNAYLR